MKALIYYRVFAARLSLILITTVPGTSILTKHNTYCYCVLLLLIREDNKQHPTILEDLEGCRIRKYFRVSL